MSNEPGGGERRQAPEPKKLQNSESASKLTRFSDSLFDGKELKLGFLEMNNEGQANTEEQKKQKAGHMADYLNNNSVQLLTKHSFTAEYVLNMQEKVQAALKNPNNQLAGFYINSSAKKGELSSLAAIIIADYVVQNPEVKPTEEVMKTIMLRVNKMAEVYHTVNHDQPKEQLDLSVALLGKDGEMAATAVGKNAVVIERANGFQEKLESNSSFLFKGKEKTYVKSGNYKMAAGEKIVLCSADVATKIQKNKSVQEIVTDITAIESSTGQIHSAEAVSLKEEEVAVTQTTTQETSQEQTTPADSLSPAPTTGQEDTEEKEKPLPPKKEIEFGIAAAKHRTEINTQGKVDTGREIEVLEEKSRELARLMINEEKNKWQGRFSFLKQYVPRMWKFTFGEVATYNKEKKHALALLASSGLQMTGVDHPLFSQIDTLARQSISQRRGGLLSRAGGRLNDLFHEMSFTAGELHQERVKIMDQLRQALDNPNIPANQQFLQNNQQLMLSFQGAVSGDYAASEALARRMTDLNGQLVDGIAGERRGANAVAFDGTVRTFIVNNVISPLITEGFANNGNINPDTIMKARKQLQELFFRPEFVQWYDRQDAATQQALRESLSYGSDLIPVIQEVILPQVLQAKEYLKTKVNLDQYLQDMVLKVNVGTMEAGQKGTIQEGFLERAASRTITNNRVHELYQNIRRNGNGPQLIPDTYQQASVQRSELIGRIAKATVAHQVVMGLGVAGGLYLAKASIGGLGRLGVPIIGGSIASGVVRGFQEARLFKREYEEHEVERELGYTFNAAARRRKEMTGLERHKRQMQTELTDPMNQLRTRIENNDPNITDGDLMNIMALVADTKARVHLANIRGVGLLSAQNPQSYQIEKRNLDLARANSTIALTNYFNRNAAQLTNINNSLNIRVPVGANALDHAINELMNAQVANIERGVIDANYQAALGNLTLRQKEWITARERSFQLVRARRVGGAFLSTALAGAGGYLATNFVINQAAELAANSNIDWLRGVGEKIGLVRHEGPNGNIKDLGGDIKLNLPKDYDAGINANDPKIIDVTNTKTGEVHQLAYQSDANGGHIVGAPSKFSLNEIKLQDRDVFKGWNPENSLPADKDQIVNGIKVTLPASYDTIPTANGINIKDDFGGVHTFLYTKDAQGQIVGLQPVAPIENLVPYYSQATVSNINPNINLPPNINPNVLINPNQQLPIDIQKLISDPAVLKGAGMAEVPYMEQKHFHVLWPEHVKATGDHAGHELELHFGGGVDAVTKQWFNEKGVINFGGVINKESINPHIPGLEPRHDLVLEKLIDGAPDKQIDQKDMFVYMLAKNGQKIFAPLDAHGNFRLPAVLQDAAGKPNPKFFDEIGLVVLENPADGKVIQAADWFNSPSRPQLAGMKEHFLNSIKLGGDGNGDGGNGLPPGFPGPSEPPGPPEGPRTNELYFNIREPVLEKMAVNQVDVSVYDANKTDFGIPFFIPRRPLEAPEGVVGQTPVPPGQQQGSQESETPGSLSPAPANDGQQPVQSAPTGQTSNKDEDEETVEEAPINQSSIGDQTSGQQGSAVASTTSGSSGSTEEENELRKAIQEELERERQQQQQQEVSAESTALKTKLLAGVDVPNADQEVKKRLIESQLLEIVDDYGIEQHLSIEDIMSVCNHTILWASKTGKDNLLTIKTEDYVPSEEVGSVLSPVTEGLYPTDQNARQQTMKVFSKLLSEDAEIFEKFKKADDEAKQGMVRLMIGSVNIYSSI